MMYRPSPSAQFVRAYAQRAVAAGVEAIGIAADALKGALISSGIYEMAMRENRRHDRAAKWRRKWSHYTAHNETPGCRAASRRLRQNAHANQMNSHKPGTVWPRHLGDRDVYVLDAVLAS